MAKSRWNKFWNTASEIKQLAKDKVIKEHSDLYILPWIRKTLGKGLPKEQVENLIQDAANIGMSRKELSAFVQLTLNINKRRVADHNRLQGLTGKSKTEKLDPLYGGEFSESDGKKRVEALMEGNNSFLDYAKKFSLSKVKTRDQFLKRVKSLKEIWDRDIDAKGKIFLENYVRAIRISGFKPTPEDVITRIKDLRGDSIFYFARLAPPIPFLYLEKDKALLLRQINEALFTSKYVEDAITEKYANAFIDAPTYEEYEELVHKGYEDYEIHLEKQKALEAKKALEGKRAQTGGF